MRLNRYTPEQCEADYKAAIEIAKADNGLDVNFTLRNTGGVDSDEVPQAYLGAPSEIPNGVQFPVWALVAFDRVPVTAGESKSVTLHVVERQLQYRSTEETA